MGQICALRECIDRPDDLQMRRDAGASDLSASVDGGGAPPDLAAQVSGDLAGVRDLATDRDGAVDAGARDLAGVDEGRPDLAGVDEGARDLAGVDEGPRDLAGADLAGVDEGARDLAGVDEGARDLAGADLAGPDMTAPPDMTTPPDFAAPKKRVFVTSVIYPATFGGLTGADASCLARANAAGLGGTWKAWLSDAKTNAADRLAHFSGVYTLVDGTPVAFGWGQLVSGSLLHSINQTESGGAPPAGTNACFGGNKPTAWTATTTMGQLLAGSCTSWTSLAADTVMVWGSPESAGSAWTQYCTSGMADNCKSSAALYCIEQ